MLSNNCNDYKVGFLGPIYLGLDNKICFRVDLQWIYGEIEYHGGHFLNSRWRLVTMAVARLTAGKLQNDLYTLKQLYSNMSLLS